MDEKSAEIQGRFGEVVTDRTHIEIFYFKEHTNISKGMWFILNCILTIQCHLRNVMSIWSKITT